MRYPKEYKNQARQRLLDYGARHAKQHGFAASGMDAIASAAGVTSGSLYKHFDSKSSLFAAMIRAELQRTTDLFADGRLRDADAAKARITAYLSTRHLRHPERGCPLPALTAEIARADDTVRAAFDDGLRQIHKQLKVIAGSSTKAWALLAQNVGALMLARAALAPALQQELLRSARKEARASLSQDCSHRSLECKRKML